MKQNDLSAVFPPMTDSEMNELRAEIEIRGLRMPIVLHGGRSLMAGSVTLPAAKRAQLYDTRHSRATRRQRASSSSGPT